MDRTARAKRTNRPDFRSKAQLLNCQFKLLRRISTARRRGSRVNKSGFQMKGSTRLPSMDKQSVGLHMYIFSAIEWQPQRRLAAPRDFPDRIYQACLSLRSRRKRLLGRMPHDTVLSGWLAGWLSGGLAGCLAGWLAGWLVGWVPRWLAGWLACWLAGWLAG